MNNFAILNPGTIFMSNHNNDEVLHEVPFYRSHNDPFIIDISFQTMERVYWTGSNGIEYSAFTSDVKNI